MYERCVQPVCQSIWSQRCHRPWTSPRRRSTTRTPAGPVVLFVHGLLVDGSLWRKVVAELDGFRCVVPTLPLGSHRTPARDRSALTPTGVADLLAEFMER